MIIDKTHRRWCLVTLVALVALTAAYVLYVRQSINGPSGGSRPGLWFGVLAAGLMLYAFALAIRRRFPSNAGLGSGQFWLRGHLWLGALTLPVALFHSGFRFGGPLEQWLMGMFLVVILTGLYGVVVQQLIPRLMRLEVPQETFLSQVGHLANRQRLLCDREVAKACGPLAVDADPLVVSLHHLFDRLSATTTREEREAWLGHVAAEHKNLLAGVARVAKDNNWQIRRDGKVSGLRQLSDLPFAFPLVYDWPATEPAAAPATTPAAAGKPAVAAAAQPAGAQPAGAKPAATPAATGPVPEASPGSATSPAKLGSRPGAATPGKPSSGAKAPAGAASDPVTTPTGTKGSQSAAVAVADDEEECADASQSTTFDVLEMLKELKQTAEIRLSGEFPALSFEDEFEAPGLDAPPLIVESIKPVSVPPPDVPQAAKGASSGQAPAAAKPTGAKPSPAEMLAAARAKQAVAAAPAAPAAEAPAAPAAKPAGGKPSAAEMLAAARAKQAGAAAPATPEAEAPAAPAAKPAGGKPSPAEMLAAARAKQAGATAPATPAAEAPAAPAAKPAGGKPSPAEMLAAAKARQAGGAASPAPAAKPSPAEMLAKAGQGAAGAAPAAMPPVPKKPATASAPPAPAPIPEHRLAALKEFYLTQVRPYLGGPGKAGSELGNADASRALFSRQRAEFPATLHPQLLELEAACDETRQLRRARQLHRWLHGWLAIHIPASVAVIVLLVLHIVLALRVNPFSF